MRTLKFDSLHQEDEHKASLLLSERLFVNRGNYVSGFFENNDLIVSNEEETVRISNVFTGIFFSQYQISYPGCGKDSITVHVSV